MRNFLFTTLISSAAAISLSATAVQATPLTWQLSGWNFDDGGTATGSFVYDADTNLFSNISVTTGGGTVPTNAFVRDDPFSPSSASGLAFATLDGLFGFDSLLVNLSGALTNAGGSVFTSNFSVFDIDTFSIASNDGIGELTARAAVAAVPLPAGGALLLMALAGITGLKRRRKTAGLPSTS